MLRTPLPPGKGKHSAFAICLLALPFALASCGARLGDAHSLAGVDGARESASAAHAGVRPTVRDLREAKAASMQEWNTLQNGGMPLYRGDGSSSNINSVKFGAAAGALTLDYRASPRLNLADGEPHALTLVVYHLSDRAAFDQLARHEEGIRKLLEGGYFDASVVGVRRHDVQPGARARLLEDRREGGRYVALVAGYGRLHARTSAHVSEYRVYRWSTAGESVFSRDKAMYSPYPMHLRATLDEEEMRVEDGDATLDRMRGVTRVRREQVFARMRPWTLSEAESFMNGNL